MLESSIARQCSGARRRCRAAVRYGSGCGLPRLTASPVTTAPKVPARQRVEHRRDEAAVGHGHQRAGRAVLAERGEELDRPVPPRDLLPHPDHHPVEQLLDDLGRLEVDPAVLAQVATGVDQVAADQVHRVLVAPGAPVLLDQGVLRRDPVRLGVDQGAVHVPEDGCRPPRIGFFVLSSRFSRCGGDQNALRKATRVTIKVSTHHSSRGARHWPASSPSRVQGVRTDPVPGRAVNACWTLAAARSRWPWPASC